MGKCNNKLKHNCGTRTNSRCVFYDIKVPTFSSLITEECVTLEETTNDIYTLIGGIKEEIDLSGLGKTCITYVQSDSTKLLVKEALLQHEKEICAIKENNNTGSTNCCIDLSKIDTKCLVDTCGVGFTNQTQLIQALIDKVCELESKIPTTNP